MKNKGQMLIVVLWVLGIVSLAIGSITVRSTHELRLSRIPLEMVARKAIAQAAVRQAAAIIKEDDPAFDHLNELWANGIDQEGLGEKVFEEIVVGDGFFNVGTVIEDELNPGLIDEESKLNINTASTTVLTRLIDIVFSDSIDTGEIVGAIQDWRSSTEGAYCSGVVPACHNDKFDTIDELKLVPGITSELFKAMRPHVTVYGTGKVNVNTASKIVLDSMGCPTDTFIDNRESEPYTSVPGGCSGLTVQSTAFNVPIEASITDSSAILKLSAVINRDGEVLSWTP